MDKQQLPRLAAELSARRVRLLAEKVEDVQQFQRCAALGFKLFQGHFFCKPATLSQKTAAPDRIQVMHTLAEIQRPGISIEQAVALIQRDVNISDSLLRCLNAVVFGLRRPVDSVRHAPILLGMARVRAWIALMALSTLHGKPHDLVRVAMVRAAMCQVWLTASRG